MQDIKSAIINKLKEIENSEQIKILYAVESGSRGWGFESKDSDYDVRFIYVHNLDWYLSIEDKRDVIEYPISKQLDFSGWDIKKALKLCKNSNPPLYEWLNSSIVYLEEGDFAQKMRELIHKFYSAKASMHHYLSMAKGNYQVYLTKEKVRIKKYFYVLRPIFACMWIEQYKTMPPMEFEKLFKAQKLDTELSDKIQRLLVRKRAGEELNIQAKIEVIDNFLEEEIRYHEDYVKILTVRSATKTDFLDAFFRKIVKEFGNKSFFT